MDAGQRAEDHRDPRQRYRHRTTSLWYEVGSKHDPEGRSGFAHLFEHILSRKTENMPYNMINRLTEDVGGVRNASTGTDRTNYYETVPAQYLETMLWTHAERMARPVVDDEVFERERSVVKEELRQRVLAPPYGRLSRYVLPRTPTICCRNAVPASAVSNSSIPPRSTMRARSTRPITGRTRRL